MSDDTDRSWYHDVDGGFAIGVPRGWTVEQDGEGGILVHREDGAGLLHMIPFERDPQVETDPAEELYAFLAEQEIELEEDEVDDLELPGLGSAAACEYVAEEEEDELVFWLMGVATAPGRLIFASYSCPAGDEEEDAEIVREILATIDFDAAAGA